jgi:hypothetical protein
VKTSHTNPHIKAKRKIEMNSNEPIKSIAEAISPVS